MCSPTYLLQLGDRLHFFHKLREVVEAQSTLARPAPSPPKAISNLLARVQAGLERQAQASVREQAREKERRERMVREQAAPNQAARAGGRTGPQAAAGTAAHTRSQPTAQNTAVGAAGAIMAKAAAAASRITMLRQEPASRAEQPVRHPDSSEGLPSWITALERTYNSGFATYPTAHSPPPPPPPGDDNLQYTSPLMASMAKG